MLLQEGGVKVNVRERREMEKQSRDWNDAL